MGKLKLTQPVVDADFLQQHLDSPNLDVVEMDIDDHEFKSGHIPGSQFWSTAQVMPLRDDPLTKTSEAEAFLGSAGISNESALIFVGGKYQATSGWLYWLFTLFGHQNMAVLDGGRNAWLNQGYSMTKDRTETAPQSYQVSKVNPNVIVNARDIEKAITDPQSGILDVRTDAEYLGQIYLSEPPKEGERVGHIPGSIHLHYDEFHNQDGTFKSLEAMEELILSVGVSPDKMVFSYCAVGARSAHVWFVLSELLGYQQVKNYSGSWREWSSLDWTPVES